MKTWGALIALCLTMFIIVLDTSMMNVAVPQISRDLGTDVRSVQAVIAIYSLVMAALMLTGAKIGNIFGSLRTFRIALYIYGVGTVIATFSANILMLGLGWSVVEGIAAAALLPLSMSLVIVNYSGAKRMLAFAVIGGFQATASAIGPIFGGVLTTYLSWRVGFAFEVAIVVVVLVMVRYIKEAEADRSQSLDWVGTLLTVAGFSSIVIGSLLAGNHGWWNARRPLTIGDIDIAPMGLSVTPWLLLIGVGFLAGFARWSARREGRGETPLVRLGIFKIGTFVSGFTTDALQSVTLAGLLFVAPLFMQQTLGFNAVGSGVAPLPLSIAVLVVSLATPRLGVRIPPKYLALTGVALMGGGIAWLAEAVAPNMGGWDFAGPLIVFGCGTGLLLAQVPNMTLSAVDPADSDEAAGVQNAAKETGTSLGTAIIGSVLMVATMTGVVSGVLRETGSPVDEGALDALVVEVEDQTESLTDEQGDAFAEQVDRATGGKLDQIVVEARVEGMRDALAAVALFILGAFIVGMFLPAGRLSARGQPETEGEVRRRAPAPARGT